MKPYNLMDLNYYLVSVPIINMLWLFVLVILSCCQNWRNLLFLEMIWWVLLLLLLQKTFWSMQMTHLLVYVCITLLTYIEWVTSYNFFSWSYILNNSATNFLSFGIDVYYNKPVFLAIFLTFCLFLIALSTIEDILYYQDEFPSQLRVCINSLQSYLLNVQTRTITFVYDLDLWIQISFPVSLFQVLTLIGEEQVSIVLSQCAQEMSELLVIVCDYTCWMFTGKPHSNCYITCNMMV